MHSNETKDKFVELRAAGKSFGDIAEELNLAKSTLHPWEDERADDIARLRRLQWEEVENRNGMRLEELLLGLTMDMKDYESTLGRFNLCQLSVRETLMILRETRRAYFQTRSLLMGAPQSRRNSREPASQLDAAKPNKTERSAENTETQPRNTNDLQQSNSNSFDSPSCAVTPTCGRSLGVNKV